MRGAVWPGPRASGSGQRRRAALIRDPPRVGACGRALGLRALGYDGMGHWPGGVSMHCPGGRTPHTPPPCRVVYGWGLAQGRCQAAGVTTPHAPPPSLRPGFSLRLPHTPTPPLGPTHSLLHSASPRFLAEVVVRYNYSVSNGLTRSDAVPLFQASQALDTGKHVQKTIQFTSKTCFLCFFLCFPTPK